MKKDNEIYFDPKMVADMILIQELRELDYEGSSLTLDELQTMLLDN